MIYVMVPIVLVTAYLWLKQFRLREQHRFYAVRSLKQIWQQALHERWSSIILFLPIGSILVVILGYIKGGWTWALITIPGMCVYAVLVIVSERYPLAEYA